MRYVRAISSRKLPAERARLPCTRKAYIRPPWQSNISWFDAGACQPDECCRVAQRSAFHVCAGDLFLVVYSIDSRESFDEARRLQEQVYQAKAGQQGQLLGVSNAAGGGGGVSTVHRPLVNAIRPTRHSSSPHVPMVIVGNKCDREAERVVDAAELKAVAETFPGSCAGVEASAKKNINVDEVWVSHDCIVGGINSTRRLSKCAVACK